MGDTTNTEQIDVQFCILYLQFLQRPHSCSSRQGQCSFHKFRPECHHELFHGYSKRLFSKESAIKNNLFILKTRFLRNDCNTQLFVDVLKYYF